MSASFEAAFDALFADRWQRLYVYLHRMTGDSDVASDVAQEVFVRLYQRGSLPSDPGAWLVSVANNLLRDEGRKRDRRRKLLTLWSGDAPVGAPAPDPALQVEGVEDRQRVRARLDSLSDRQREVLLLRADGMSYSEIATALEMPMSSVGQTLARALDAFRRANRETAGAPD